MRHFGALFISWILTEGKWLTTDFLSWNIILFMLSRYDTQSSSILLELAYSVISVVVFFLSVSIRKRQNFSLLIQSHLLWPPDFLHNTQKRTNDTVLVTVRLVTHHSMAVPPCELAESEIPIQAEDCHWCVLRWQN